MAYKNKADKIAYLKKYYSRPEVLKKRKAYSKEYRKRTGYNKSYYQSHKNKWVESASRRRPANLQSWEGLIPKVTSCQICDREIFFNQKNQKLAIHFDHKSEHNIIKRQPSDWLRSCPRNPEREKIWIEANLGMLCKDCNSYLPTKNREAFVRRVVLYVFGKDL